MTRHKAPLIEMEYFRDLWSVCLPPITSGGHEGALVPLKATACFPSLRCVTLFRGAIILKKKKKRLLLNCAPPLNCQFQFISQKQSVTGQHHWICWPTIPKSLTVMWKWSMTSWQRKVFLRQKSSFLSVESFYMTKGNKSVTPHHNRQDTF